MRAAVQVIMPKYDCLRYDLVSNIREMASFHWSGAHIRVFRGLVEGLATTFLEPDNGMFWVGCVYGRNDDAHRFNFFCGAALEYLKHHAPAKTDIVHCHDWPTAPVAFGDIGNSRCADTPLAPRHACHAASSMQRVAGATPTAGGITPVEQRSALPSPQLATSCPSTTPRCSVLLLVCMHAAVRRLRRGA
jgi:starch synthase